MPPDTDRLLDLILEKVEGLVKTVDQQRDEIRRELEAVRLEQVRQSGLEKLVVRLEERLGKAEKEVSDLRISLAKWAGGAAAIGAASGVLTRLLLG